MDSVNGCETSGGANRELIKLQMLLEALASDFKRSFSDLSKRLGTVETRATALSALDTELSQLRGDKSISDREIHRWEDSMTMLCDAIFRTLSFPDLNPEYRAGSESMLQNLKMVLEPLGFRIIAPNPGDQYDSRIHSIEACEEPDVWTIRSCRSWGYLAGNQTIRPAGVVLGGGLPDPSVAVPITISQFQVRRCYSQRTWLGISSICFVLIAGIFLYFLFDLPSSTSVLPSSPLSFTTSTPLSTPLSFSSILMGEHVGSPLPGPTLLSSLPLLPGPPLLSSCLSLSVSPSLSSSSSLMQWPVVTVVSGDSLWKLAESLYGDGRFYTILVAANHLTSDRIYPGQILHAPGVTIESKESSDAR